jgi:two-component system, sensor histidine kinase
MFTTDRGPRRVLLVEDNPDGREFLAMLLRLWGYEVEVAGDGPEGLRKALDWRPRAVLLDIGLPGLDGWQVARRLREQEGRAVLLVALTGYGREEDEARSRRAGFDAHLTKPADLMELRRLLENAAAPVAVA